ncbi:endopeptidase [Plectonema phage JingP1]|uniref:Endopeptidase n=1 Tax=Plectonema phage JingP1 TaxID=2961687 RepID=A0A9E7NPD3_9CAUD|nr:endopeptidase [Plectonema phage JingP1]
MPSPLKPLGFDIPGSQPVGTNVPQQLPQPDSTTLQVLSQTSQRFDQSLQASTQAAQQIAQSTAGMYQAAAQGSQAIAESSIRLAQANANRAAQNAETVGNLGQTVMRVASQYAERQVKMQEQLQAAQEAAAVQELEALRVEWIQNGKLDKDGVGAYQDVLTSTIGKYNIPPKSITELTQRYYSPALDYAQKAEANRQDAIKDAAQQQRRVTHGQFQAKLSNSLAALAAYTPGSDEARLEDHISFVRKSITELMGNEEIPLGDRLSAVADALEVTNKTLMGRRVEILEFNDLVSGTREVRQKEAELMREVVAGRMSASQYNAEVSQIAMERGLKDFKVTDPYKDLETTYNILNTSQNIVKIQNETYTEGLNAIPVDIDTIAALATEYVLSPGAWGAVRNLEPKDLDRNGREAVKIKNEWDTYVKDERPQLAIDIQRGETRKIGLKSDYERWYIEARRSAEQNQQVQTPSKILESLRGFAPEIAQQFTGKPLTVQDVEVIAGAYSSEIAAITQEQTILRGKLTNRDSYFGQYGLSTDMNTVRANNQARKKALRERESRLQQLQLEKLKMPQIPGAQPNFNGAALPRKPLAKGNYAGKTITFPFEASVAATLRVEQGQMYGDGRKNSDGSYRSHQGLDFAVPTGTKTLALVPGKIINVRTNYGGYGTTVEMLGDDGHKYFYAHNSRILAQKGQRVNAGDAIALTGNTGVGSGPHLHLEVTDPNGKIINPLAHLASRDFTAPPQPLSAGSSRPTGAPPAIPAGAIPMGKNTFLHNGKVIKLSYGFNTPTTKESPARYSTAAPIRNSYAGQKTGGGAHDANHGYAILANDQKFASQLNAIARKHGIEPEWLADVMAHETDNTFDPQIPNYDGSGHYGLIQFGPDALKDLGVTKEQLLAMPRLQQLTLVDKYLTLQTRYSGVDKIKTPAELAAAVFMGGGGLAELRRTGRIGGELAEYLSKMGRFAGRRYDSSANRRNRVSTVIHDRPAVACSLCANMQASSFFPHESQEFNA